MMRYILLSAASAFAISSACAADMWDGPGLKDGYAPVINWAGAYIGASAGYAWNGNSLLNIETANMFSEVNLAAQGALAGLQGGYNWQQGRFVFGIETDIQGASLTSNAATSLPASGLSPSLSTSAQVKSSLDWFGTVRGRAGAAVFGQGFLYATGGFAYGQSDQSISLTGYNAPIQNTAGAASRSIATGYTVGGGFEYAFNRAWSFKTEYQYVDLGTVSVAEGFVVGGQAFSGIFSADRGYQTVRGAVNYHLNSAYEPLK